MSTVGPISPPPTHVQAEPPAKVVPTPHLAQTPSHADRSDSVDLSNRAKAFAALRDGDKVRRDLVDRVRADIERGAYLTDQRLEQAIDALLDDLLRT